MTMVTTKNVTGSNVGDDNSRVAVQVQGVSLSYGGGSTVQQTVLEDVNLKVREGEFISLLGPSGCGKTSLLNLIAGFIEPSSGAVTVEGRHVRGPDPDCGVVFQDYALFPWYSVRKNVEFGPRMRGVSSAESRAVTDKYIEMVGLKGFESRYPSKLSGGMKQRAGLARALANQPRVLLLDEPFAAVDAMTRDRLQEELQSIWSLERITCIFVTHSFAEAVYLADRVVILNGQRTRGIDVVDIDIPRPRDRGSPAFAAAVGALEDAMRGRGEDAEIPT